MINENENSIDNRLDMLKYMAQVQSTIKDEITTDFVYAKLTDKDKTAIIEITANAYLSRKLLKTVVRKTKKWQWKENAQQESYWEKVPLSQEEQKLINHYGSNIFQSFMTRMMMLAILNRNLKDNYLVKYSVGAAEEETKEDETTQQTDFMKKLGNILKSEKGVTE